LGGSFGVRGDAAPQCFHEIDHALRRGKRWFALWNGDQGARISISIMAKSQCSRAGCSISALARADDKRD
jgi:hypothetical protein